VCPDLATVAVLADEERLTNWSDALRVFGPRRPQGVETGKRVAEATIRVEVRWAVGTPQIWSEDETFSVLEELVGLAQEMRQ